ncbi:MAG: mechanosensitive ion channel [Gracilimonas sp.]|uniref:mechanosensitive ion channel family protein n=1 Tax=Gracilimonas TaxID=649462 RepID=UPI001B10A615|nr:mechanosensitive ion channel domain-containing protein [Gracilimonas sp.]MBO6587248.1 mechanosensitive ion channel [Gracilimonas sp.]MBO6614264.1 mechanosensitive ion channel [Gracilimonas sp.]
MALHKYIWTLLVLLLLNGGLVSSLSAQNTVQQNTASARAQDTTLTQRIDSLINERLSRLDSLTMRLEQQAGLSEDTTQVSGDAEQALAQLEQVISWPKVLTIILFFIATYYVTSFISTILGNFSERISKYRLRIKRMVPIVRVVLWTLAIYVAIAGIIQPPYATIITVMASVGIAVGLASQDVLKNLFGGVMLILDRPFQVGDKIQFADHYGEVQQIGLRSSRIVTPGDSVVTIPNGELIRTAVSNANTGALDCLVVTNIYLPAECPVEEVKEVAYKAVIASRFVFLKKPISIMTENEMHERRFVLKLKVKAYVLDIRYEFPFQSDVTELILTELKKRGIIRDETLHQELVGD